MEEQSLREWTLQSIKVVEEMQRSINKIVRKFNLCDQYHPLSVLDIGLFALLCQLELAKKGLEKNAQIGTNCDSTKTD